MIMQMLTSIQTVQTEHSEDIEDLQENLRRLQEGVDPHEGRLAASDYHSSLERPYAQAVRANEEPPAQRCALSRANCLRVSSFLDG